MMTSSAGSHLTGNRRRISPVAAVLISGLVVGIYPLVFWIGRQSGWWNDPDGEMWVLFVMTLLVSLSMLGAAFLNSSADTSVGRLLGSSVVLAVGLPMALILGFAAGLSGFSCSGGAIGEGCSGGSVLAGLVVGGLVLGGAGWLARVVGRPNP